MAHWVKPLSHPGVPHIQIFDEIFEDYGHQDPSLLNTSACISQEQEHSPTQPLSSAKKLQTDIKIT